MEKTFAELGLDEHILNGIKNLGFTTPTPVQEQAIPQVLDGRDVVAIAQTGTGKTAAFTLPTLQLTEDKNINKRHRGPYTLVISPTRELAQQAGKVVDAIKHETGQKCVVVTGGQKFGPQINACQRGCHTLVATPGRLQDLINRNVIHLNEVQCLVLDEADRMLDMGFWKDIKKIMTELPEKHQTLLFSATMPTSIQQTVEQMLNNPVRIEIAKSGDTADNVEEFLCPVTHNQKADLLVELLKQEKPRRALVFCRTKRRVDNLNEQLRKEHFRSAPMHSDCSQNKRERSLDKFRKGNLEILVATDVLARGIDVDNVELVVNYDTPVDAEDYVHRIGRTGRAGASGKAYTFMQPDEMQSLRAIEFFTKSVLPIYDIEGFDYNEKRLVPPEDRQAEKPKRPAFSNRRGSGNKRGGYRRRPSSRGGRGRSKSYGRKK